MKKKNNILKFYNNCRLSYKMLFAFIFGGLIPIIVIQQVSYYVSTHYMTEKVDEMALNNLTQMAERTDLTLDIYTNLLYQIYVDDDIVSNINALIDGSTSEMAIAINRIFNQLKQYNFSEKGLRCISVVCENGITVTYDYETGSGVDTLWRNQGDMRETQPYKDAKEAGGMVLTPTMAFSDNRKDTYVFHISKRIFDFNHLEKGTMATVIMSIDAEVLNEILQSEEQKKVNWEQEFTFIIDEERRIVSYPVSMFMGTPLDEKITLPRFITISGLMREKEPIINQYKDAKTGWTFCYVYDKQYMLKDIQAVQHMFLLIGIALIIISILLIIYTTSKVHTSVKKVIYGMDQVKEGNLDAKVLIESEDEIGKIAENFNEMTQEVKRLIQEVKEATHMQKNAEIKALEAQINPHFLYNTLDSINWMAIEKGEYEISKMLRNLGIILRYSVNKSNQLVTIEEMKDWIIKYISLQKMRFNDAFDLKLTVQEETKEVRVYKLLLQPFIENAIIHGFNGIEQGGVLSIDILLIDEKSRLCIIIEDNGTGMPQEQVLFYNNRQLVLEQDTNSIGVSNVFHRMNMYYGEEAEWNVNSIEGMGTVITLKIPIFVQEGV